jgi:hypothetical protein
MNDVRRVNGFKSTKSLIDEILEGFSEERQNMRVMLTWQWSSVKC